MKTLPTTAVLLALVLAACSSGEQDFYGVEKSGHLVGYIAVTTTFADDGVTREQVSKETYMKLTLLGQPVDIRARDLWTLDPASQRAVRFETSSWFGSDMRLSNLWTFEGEQAQFQPRTGGRDSTLVLDPEVIVDDGRPFPALTADRFPRPGTRQTLRELDLMRGRVGEVEYTRRDDESLVFGGQEFDCRVYDAYQAELGTSVRVWLDAQGRLVKLTAPDGTVVTRAGRDVRSRVRRASIDDVLFADVDTRIEDPRSLVALEVEATVRSAGRLITVESLNVPGQRFTGDVQRNLIDGVFRIERTRYEGENAPAFPPPSWDPELRRWLEPELLIESDDPVLVEAARDITASAPDAWQAVVRIAAWVAENLEESVPGGSARQTYDARRGECGSHARLTAALCRASGIACRVVSGCMYIAWRDGSFGQHAWNEVYMGEAGWVPLDTTVDEIGSIDAGHIRLGEQVTFNPVRMKILDFQTEVPPSDPGR